MSNDIEHNATDTESTKIPVSTGSPTLAWVSLALALLAWVILIRFNGYVALGTAIASAVCGFIAMPRRSANIKRLAITAVIASIVLIVVVSAYLVVIKIGLS